MENIVEKEVKELKRVLDIRDKNEIEIERINEEIKEKVDKGFEYNNKMFALDRKSEKYERLSEQKDINDKKIEELNQKKESLTIEWWRGLASIRNELNEQIKINESQINELDIKIEKLRTKLQENDAIDTWNSFFDESIEDKQFNKEEIIEELKKLLKDKEILERRNKKIGDFASNISTDNIKTLYKIVEEAKKREELRQRDLEQEKVETAPEEQITYDSYSVILTQEEFDALSDLIKDVKAESEQEGAEQGEVEQEETVREEIQKLGDDETEVIRPNSILTLSDLQHLGINQDDVVMKDGKVFVAGKEVEIETMGDILDFDKNISTQKGEQKAEQEPITGYKKIKNIIIGKEIRIQYEKESMERILDFKHVKRNLSMTQEEKIEKIAQIMGRTVSWEEHQELLNKTDPNVICALLQAREDGVSSKSIKQILDTYMLSICGKPEEKEECSKFLVYDRTKIDNLKPSTIWNRITRNKYYNRIKEFAYEAENGERATIKPDERGFFGKLFHREKLLEGAKEPKRKIKIFSKKNAKYYGKDKDLTEQVARKDTKRGFMRKIRARGNKQNGGTDMSEAISKLRAINLNDRKQPIESDKEEASAILEESL